MVLNYEEIKNKRIIEFSTESQFSDGSYNLTVDKVIDMSNKVHESLTLKPQGMIYVIFKEKIVVPEDVIGFAHVKTSLTQLGIMAINIGIIDPNYNGYISTLLINFGKCEHFFTEGDVALRLTFAQMKAPEKKVKLKQNSVAFEMYQKNVQRNVSNLDDKFLNLGSVKNDVTKHIFKILIGMSIIFSAGSFALSAYFNHKSSSEKNLDSAIKKYEIQVSTLEESNKYLQEQLKNQSTSLQDLKNELKNQKSLKQRK